jgi:hypothetical protein
MKSNSKNIAPLRLNVIARATTNDRKASKSGPTQLKLGTNDKWEKRKSIVLKLPVKSMCQVYSDSKERDLSLGLIRPTNISFSYSKTKISERKDEKKHSQLDLFSHKKPLIQFPYSFYYQFSCHGVADCPSHKLSIIDWEIFQALFSWRDRYQEEPVLMQMIEQKWMNIANLEKNDVYFFVGNMKRLRKVFMVLGVFYPPKR